MNVGITNYLLKEKEKKNKSAYLSIIKVMAEIPIANTINIYFSIIGYVDFFLAPDFTRCSFCIKCKKTQGNTKKKTYTCATKNQINYYIINVLKKSKQDNLSWILTISLHIFKLCQPSSNSELILMRGTCSSIIY